MANFPLSKAVNIPRLDPPTRATIRGVLAANCVREVAARQRLFLQATKPTGVSR